MNRKSFVRVELIALAVVTLLLAYRVTQGPPEPTGAVVLSDIGVDEIRRDGFSVARGGDITIDAVGSFETADRGDSALAAYGWILDRTTRNVVWQMDPRKLKREQGNIASVRDTVALRPGLYDAYFTSYGNRNNSRFGFSLLGRLFGNEAAWRNDESKWKLIIREESDEGIGIEHLRHEVDQALAPTPADLVWSTAPMRGRQTEEYVFQVSEPIEMAIHALGEIDNRRMDHGWIEEVFSRDRIWEMTLENTRHAGGWSVNRIFRDTLSVQPGTYRSYYETDPLQGWGDWRGNPPFDPAAWGITLSGDPIAAISAFDPLSSRTPLIELTRVGDDERRLAQFRVSQPVQLAAYALGEIGEGSRYDWAWLRSNDSQESIWEMTRENSREAGGDDSNRAELAFFTLEPGAYTLGYETDDSHSFESWRRGRPHLPDRWGVALYPVHEQIDTIGVEVLGFEQMSLGEDEEIPPPPDPPSIAPELPGSTIASLAPIGNEQRQSTAFTLDEASTLQVVAVGEISISGRYDYGWIENAETGEVVWEMTWQNTEPAGGADRNRHFAGTISLDPGQYVVHYRSDFSHAYGDFGDEPPLNPEFWGVRISKL